MTFDEVLAEAKARWPDKRARTCLVEKYQCTPLYIDHILSGNKRMPYWMLVELGFEKVVEVTYRRKEA